MIQAQLAAESIAPNSTLAFIGSLGVSFIAFGAIFMGRLIRWIGARNAGFLSCLLMGGGQILSSASSKNVGGLFVTNGIIVGLGTSMSFMVVFLDHFACRYTHYLRSYVPPFLRNILDKNEALLTVPCTELQEVSKTPLPTRFQP